jgi:multiple sugar transport system permease protein
MALLLKDLPRPRPKKGRWFKQKAWAPYLFLSPTILFFIVFLFLPIVFSFYLTFTKWNPLATPEWIGLENYRFLLTDETFFITLRNTFYYAFGVLLLELPLALLFAFLFSVSRAKAFWRAIYWLPMVTNIAAIAYLWGFLLDGTYGLVNLALAQIGITGPQWLTDPNSAMIAVILVTVWLGLGQSMLVFSAGLEGVDETFYEAAKVDGASTPRIFRDITLPLLKPTILFVSITTFIGVMGSFALILVLTNGGPLQSTNTTSLLMYQTAFQDLRMGRASAMAFILFVLIFLVTLVQLRLFRRGGIEAY